MDLVDCRGTHGLPGTYLPHVFPSDYFHHFLSGTIENRIDQQDLITPSE